MAAPPMSTALGVIFYWLLVHINIRGDTCMIKREDNYLTIPVRNGSCVVYNWKEMTCIWDLNVIMFESTESSGNKSTGYQNTNHSTNINFNHVDFDITLEWTVFNRFSLCPNRVIKENCLTCRFSENDGEDSFRIDNYTFRLQINNTKRNLSKTSEWIFDTETLVQPDGVNDLTVIPYKTEIDVQWKHTKFHYAQKFKIQYQSWQDSKWKPIKEADRNGHITAYRITIENEYELEREQLIAPGNSTSVIMDIRSNTTIAIRLTQRTNVGYPNKKDASITIAPIKDRPSVPKNILIEAIDPSYIIVSWELSTSSEDSQYLDNVTVVICKKSQDNVCQGIIKSLTQPVVENHLRIELSEGTYRDYLFGVSVESYSQRYGEIISSGVKWSDCIYQKRGVSTKPLRVHLVMDSVYQNSMVVRWTRYDCSESIGYVQNYVLNYCVSVAENCTESHILSVDRNKLDYKMTNLLPGKYKVWLNANFSGGLGPESEVLNFQVYKKEFDSEEKPSLIFLLIIFLTFVIFLILCVIGLMLRRYCRNINKSLEIDIPKPYMSVADRKKKIDLPPSHSSSGSSATSENSPFIRPTPRGKTVNENTIMILEDISTQSKQNGPETNKDFHDSPCIDHNNTSHFIKCKSQSESHILDSLNLIKDKKEANDMSTRENELRNETVNFLAKEEQITHRERELSTNNEQHNLTGTYKFDSDYVKANCTASNLYEEGSVNGCRTMSNSSDKSVDDYLKTYVVALNSGQFSAISYCDVSIRQLSKSTGIGSKMIDRKYIDDSKDCSDVSL